MKAIAKLKDDARRHEQKEEWEKAIAAYLQVLHLADQGDSIELDLPLYNRVGDLFVRLGRERDAVTYYEQAADRYAEAGLYNNAIALCNKALRYDEARLGLLKKLGSFSASQGFFTDARRWYLEYAEKSIRLGAVDEAIAAMSELAHVSEDPEIRELLARQLRDHGRTRHAMDEYRRAYAMRIAAGQEREAQAILSALQQIDPAADVTAQAAPQPALPPVPFRRHEEELPGFVDASTAVEPAAEAEIPSYQEPAETFEPEPPAERYEIDELPGFDAPEPTGERADFEEPEPLATDEFVRFDVDSFTTEINAVGGLEGANEIGPMEVEEEQELFDLSTFRPFGSTGQRGTSDLTPLDEDPLAVFDDAEPMADFDELETSDRLLGSEIGELERLDIGEIEQEELGLAGAPLPPIDSGFTPDADAQAAGDAEEVPVAEETSFPPDHELEFWTQPYGAAQSGADEGAAAETTPHEDASAESDGLGEAQHAWEAEPADVAAPFSAGPEPASAEFAAGPDDEVWGAPEAADEELAAHSEALETAPEAAADAGAAEVRFDEEATEWTALEDEAQQTWTEYDEEQPIDLKEPRFALDAPRFEIDAPPTAAAAEDVWPMPAEQEFEIAAETDAPESPAHSVFELEPGREPAASDRWESPLTGATEPAAFTDADEAVIESKSFEAEAAAPEAAFEPEARFEQETIEPDAFGPETAFEAAPSEPDVPYAIQAEPLQQSADVDYEPGWRHEPAAAEPMLEATPPASGAEAGPEAPAQEEEPAEPQYVDLAALLGEDDEEVADSTRFVVAELPPTGDEEKDFADLLQQFKKKVAETIPREDAGSHYDLGLAFKEMGLIDEAIGEFQTALRSGQQKLRVYEELGSCFVLKQQYGVAITVLNRAQQMPCSDESELLGVYYNLGRAHEELGQRAEAKVAYEKIIGIDVGFQDTRARLARL